jgi:hypothetical protein
MRCTRTGYQHEERTGVTATASLLRGRGYVDARSSLDGTCDTVVVLLSQVQCHNHSRGYVVQLGTASLARLIAVASIYIVRQEFLDLLERRGRVIVQCDRSRNQTPYATKYGSLME